MEGAPRFMRVHILGKDDQALDDELDLSPIEIVISDLCESVCIPVPLALKARQYVLRHGDFPESVAVTGFGVEESTALATALGVHIPFGICMAATMASRFGIDSIIGNQHEPVIKAYFGLISRVKDEVSINGLILLSCDFWSHIMDMPDLLALCANYWDKQAWCQTQGIVSVDTDKGLCVVTATGYAFPIGFDQGVDTVVVHHVNEDGDSISVEIGTIAQDTGFMHQIHQDLNERELNELANCGFDMDEESYWVICGGDYIKMPALGTMLNLDEVVNVVKTYAPEPKADAVEPHRS